MRDTYHPLGKAALLPALSCKDLLMGPTSFFVNQQSTGYAFGGNAGMEREPHFGAPTILQSS